MAMTPQDFTTGRQSLGLSIRALAKLLGVDEKTVRRWETRRPHPVAVTCLRWLLEGRVTM